MLQKFIEKAKLVHGDDYDYSRVIYVNRETRVELIHNICRVAFTQTPLNHLKGHGCSQCKGVVRLSKDEFINRAAQVHGSEYDYTNVNYINNRTKIEIVHNICGFTFSQVPNSHLSGSGCPKCSGNLKVTTEMFIEKAISVHGDEYDYSRVIYVDNETRIEIIHKNCGISFIMTPHAHIRKNRGCWKCDGSMKLTIEDFIQKANEVHDYEYDYTNSIYINTRSKLDIIHKKCGTRFSQKAHNHVINQQGCPKCSCANFSKIAIEWLNRISDLLGIHIQHAGNSSEYTVYSNQRKYKLDGVNHEWQIAFEFNGDYWHGNPECFNPADINTTSKLTYGELHTRTLKKEQDLKNLGWTVISIWENDYRNGDLLTPEDIFHFFLDHSLPGLRNSLTQSNVVISS